MAATEELDFVGPLDEPLMVRHESPASALPTRQVWIARDGNRQLWCFPFRPRWDGGRFHAASAEQALAHLPTEWFPHLEPGMCQAFVQSGARHDLRIGGMAS